MAGTLAVSIGQHSEKGRKETNQDFHGALIPKPPALALKGIAIALADGISSSSVSQVAAETAIKTFLTDYYCTSDSWTVKTAAERVIAATNSWLYAETRRSQYAYDRDKGYVCTFSVLILKSTAAHIFHIGDSRIYRLSGDSLEQLTTDHRVVLSSQESYLGRALGINPYAQIDYRTLQIEAGDHFVLTTDGIHEHVTPGFIAKTIGTHPGDLEQAARTITQEAFANGSADNLTIQILRVDGLPMDEAQEVLDQAPDLPLPPVLDARMEFDGYRILRQIHASSRSHIYLAEDLDDGEVSVLKIPSVDLRGDAAYLKRFMMEEWIARRVNSAYVLRPKPRTRKRNYLYIATEFVDGQTLTQWMVDHPRPDLETVRDMVEQIAKGLRAFHRLEMVHQDLRPENIMIDRSGTLKIIDFGSTRVAGVIEAEPNPVGEDILGTHQYTAPEYFIGEPGSDLADLYSLGVITYQMLTGHLPYGARMAQARTRSQQARVSYTPVSAYNRDVPGWIDAALKQAVQPDPRKRQEVLSEFTHDLRHPGTASMGRAAQPLIERNPVLFWKIASAVLAATALALSLWR